jgi:hypothetical protein
MDSDTACSAADSHRAGTLKITCWGVGLLVTVGVMLPGDNVGIVREPSSVDLGLRVTVVSDVEGESESSPEVQEVSKGHAQRNRTHALIRQLNDENVDRWKE